MKSLTLGKCHVRRVKELDYPELERMYLEHEGSSLPMGYYSEFREAIRNPEVDYFVAEVAGRVIGGGGVSEYIPKKRAQLIFGIVDPEQCGKGYGTAILISRFLYIESGADGCQILLQATEWSGAFFRQMGFNWYGKEEDEDGNRFLFGVLMIYSQHEKEFRSILKAAGVTTDFNRGHSSSSNHFSSDHRD